MEVNNKYKQTFHPCVPSGWANDPNGLIFYRGEAHLFYQHYPYRPKWGPMHWGHFKSKDFVKWENLPVALAPDEPYEVECGCCSGSAVEVDGDLVLMYTAAQSDLQRQCLARSTDGGVTFKKHDGNPILTAEMLSPEVSMRDFRDPFVFVRGGYYYALAGTRITKPDRTIILKKTPSGSELVRDEKLRPLVGNPSKRNPSEIDTLGEGNLGWGNMILFKSKDLLNWEYVGKLIYEQEEIPDPFFRLDGVYECPTYFVSGDKDIIISSPQNLPQMGWDFQNQHSVLYMAGKFNLNDGHFYIEDMQEMDSGFDIYAAQTMITPDARVVMIAWKEMWDRVFPTEPHNWVGTYTLPRELSYHDGRLYQHPVREIYNYRQNKVEVTDFNIYHEVKSFEGIKGNKIELSVEFDLSDDAYLTGVKVAQYGDECIYIYYDKIAKTVCFDRSLFPLGGREFNTDVRRCTVGDLTNVTFQIFIDVCSVEVFVNDGRYTLTGNFYGDLEKHVGVQVFSSGHAHFKYLTKYDIIVE